MSLRKARWARISAAKDRKKAKRRRYKQDRREAAAAAAAVASASGPAAANAAGSTPANGLTLDPNDDHPINSPPPSSNEHAEEMELETAPGKEGS